MRMSFSVQEFLRSTWEDKDQAKLSRLQGVVIMELTFNKVVAITSWCRTDDLGSLMHVRRSSGRNVNLESFFVALGEGSE